jgi:hypothetical protein
MGLMQMLNFFKNGKKPLCGVGLTISPQQAFDKLPLTGNTDCALTDMPEGHLELGFERTRLPRDRIDLTTSEIKYALP